MRQTMAPNVSVDRGQERSEETLESFVAQVRERGLAAAEGSQESAAKVDAHRDVLVTCQDNPPPLRTDDYITFDLPTADLFSGEA